MFFKFLYEVRAYNHSIELISFTNHRWGEKIPADMMFGINIYQVICISEAVKNEAGLLDHTKYTPLPKINKLISKWK